jgi:hypothetical protein
MNTGPELQSQEYSFGNPCVSKARGAPWEKGRFRYDSEKQSGAICCGKHKNPYGGISNSLRYRILKLAGWS